MCQLLHMVINDSVGDEIGLKCGKSRNGSADPIDDRHSY